MACSFGLKNVKLIQVISHHTMSAFISALNTKCPLKNTFFLQFELYKDYVVVNAEDLFVI